MRPNLLNEGTPRETRAVHRGTLAKDDAGNDAPGASGADWANILRAPRMSATGDAIPRGAASSC